MKKILLIIFSLFILGSCSKDDENPIEESYGISITNPCGEKRVSYDVNKATYDRIKKIYEYNVACTWVNFTDIDNVKRTGYLAGLSSSVNK